MRGGVVGSRNGRYDLHSLWELPRTEVIVWEGSSVMSKSKSRST
jgi:hypothetical protein